jgi:hypothetical protein
MFSRCSSRILVALAAAATPAHADKIAWEAALPPGGETDPIVLNKAVGKTDASSLEQVKGSKGELRPQNFPDLAPRTSAHEGLFRVVLTKEGVVLPPDMTGTGPFFLLKAEGRYHLLTPRNFATLFGPLKTKEEVLPYVSVYTKIFLDPYASLVRTPLDVKDFQKVEPPALTEVTEAPGGWVVRVILFSAYRVRAFYEARLRVQQDGAIVVEEKIRKIKELGPGFMF